MLSEGKTIHVWIKTMCLEVQHFASRMHNHGFAVIGMHTGGKSHADETFRDMSCMLNGSRDRYSRKSAAPISPHNRGRKTLRGEIPGRLKAVKASKESADYII